MSTPGSPRRLQGWKEIAAFLDTSPRTAQRWEEYLHLPVRREARIRGAAVYALPDELCAWRVRHRKEIEEDERIAGAEPIAGSHVASAASGAAAIVSAASSGTPNHAESQAADASAEGNLALVRGTPWHRRSYATPLVMAAAVAVLGLLLVMWWQLPGLRGRRSETPSVSPHVDPSAPTAYSAPSGNTVLVMRVQVGSESAVVSTSSGAMTTVALSSRRKLALVPMVKEPAVDLLLAEVSRRAGGLEALREVARHRLLLSQPVVIEAAEGLSVEILRTSSIPAPESRPSQPPKTCCVSCGTVTLCANRVETSYGSCDAAK